LGGAPVGGFALGFAGTAEGFAGPADALTLGAAALADATGPDALPLATALARAGTVGRAAGCACVAAATAVAPVEGG